MSIGVENMSIRVENKLIIEAGGAGGGEKTGQTGVENKSIRVDTKTFQSGVCQGFVRGFQVFTRYFYKKCQEFQSIFQSIFVIIDNLKCAIW